MWSLQNVKFNIDGFLTSLILVKGGVKYRNRNLQNLKIIYNIIIFFIIIIFTIYIIY